MNEAALVRSAPDVSNLAERIDLLRKDAYNCIVMLNNMQLIQAMTHYQDLKKHLKDVQVVFEDIDRKVTEAV